MVCAMKVGVLVAMLAWSYALASCSPEDEDCPKEYDNKSYDKDYDLYEGDRRDDGSSDYESDEEKHPLRYHETYSDGYSKELFFKKPCSGPLTRDYQCGPENGNKRCPAGECCSKFGYCGLTKEHCENPLCPPAKAPKIKRSNCHGRVSKTGKCGPAFSFMRCPIGTCCNEFGNCGITRQHCTFPICPVFHEKKKLSHDDADYEEQYPEHPDYEEPSQYGYVGGSYENCLTHEIDHIDGKCGPENGGFHCKKGHCCSEDGRCGKSPEHCNVHSICPPFHPVHHTKAKGYEPKHMEYEDDIDIYVGGSHRNCRGAASNNNRCGPKFEYSHCPVGSCCSAKGRCGRSETFCNVDSLCPKFSDIFYRIVQEDDSFYKSVFEKKEKCEKFKKCSGTA